MAGLSTVLWGPTVWQILDLIGYSAENKKIEKDIAINSLQLIGPLLPCHFCRESFKDFIKEVKFNNLIDTVYTLHDLVNKKLEVKSISYINYKRKLILNKNYPLQLYQVVRFLTLISLRENIWNFIMFVSTVSLCLLQVDDPQHKLLGNLLKTACEQQRNNLDNKDIFRRVFYDFTGKNTLDNEIIQMTSNVCKDGHCV